MSSKKYLDKTGLTRVITKIKTLLNGKANISDLTKNVGYGTCDTAAATAEKIVTIPNVKFIVEVGAIIGIKFTNTNTASHVTLNVNGTGAKSIYYNAAVYTSTSGNYTGTANRTLYYMFDGTYWVWLSSGVDINSDTISSAYCGTAAGTAGKAASCTNYSLKANSHLQVLVRYANTSKTALTLNINSKGAKTIYINGSPSSSTNYTLPAGTYFVFYDGANYYFRTDAKLTADITGTSQKAVADSDGNNISSTYAKISAIPTKTSDLTNDSGFASYLTWTATVNSSSWSGSTAPYTQVINITNMKNTYIPTISLIMSNTVSTAIQEQSEYSKINRVDSQNGSILLTCFEEKPEINLNIRVESLSN